MKTGCGNLHAFHLPRLRKTGNTRGAVGFRLSCFATPVAAMSARPEACKRPRNSTNTMTPKSYGPGRQASSRHPRAGCLHACPPTLAAMPLARRHHSSPRSSAEVPCTMPSPRLDSAESALFSRDCQQTLGSDRPAFIWRDLPWAPATYRRQRSSPHSTHRRTPAPKVPWPLTQRTMAPTVLAAPLQPGCDARGFLWNRGNDYSAAASGCGAAEPHDALGRSTRGRAGGRNPATTAQAAGAARPRADPGRRLPDPPVEGAKVGTVEHGEERRLGSNAAGTGSAKRAGHPAAGAVWGAGRLRWRIDQRGRSTRPKSARAVARSSGRIRPIRARIWTQTCALLGHDEAGCCALERVRSNHSARHDMAISGRVMQWDQYSPKAIFPKPPSEGVGPMCSTPCSSSSRPLYVQFVTL